LSGADSSIAQTVQDQGEIGESQIDAVNRCHRHEGVDFPVSTDEPWSVRQITPYAFTQDVK